MSDDVTITVRVNNQTAQGFRDVNGNLRTLDGRFASTAGSMRRSGDGITKSLTGLKATLLSLAPAAVPVAASLAPIAVQAGAAGLAVAAFGAAVIPQISNLAEAAKAQDAYTTAVTKYGANSKQAAQAQAQAAEVLKGMPAATQRAAAGYSNLRDQFKAFSDSTARFTMVPVEHSFAVLGQIIPKLAPMAEATAGQFDRLVKVAGGAVNTAGFDALSKRVSTFSNQVLKSATDKAISFARALSEGNAHGPIAAFMDYARQQGPAVKDLLTNLSEAVTNLVEGAAQAGPGLLTLVNAFAKLVAAAPPELVGTLMSIYAAFKLIKLAGAGIDAVGGQFATLTTRITAMRAASTAAGGGVAGLNAALNTLSRGGKATLAAAAVTGLVLALHELSDNKGPVAVDALSTSLNTLISTGKVTGTLKTNLTDISESIAMVSKGASDNKLAQLTSDFGTFVGISTGPGISTARKNVDAWDKSMANLVRSGHTKEAAAQYDLLKRSWVAGGGDLKRLNKFTDDYKGALADQRFEAEMAAKSQGLFGSAAQATQTKLDAQKASADGLRQSIQALSDTSQSAFDAQTKFEEAIDNVTQSLKDNGRTLDVGTAKGRANRDALSQLATATKDAAAKARENGQSWEQVNSIYGRGYSSIIKNAQAMGLSKSQAKALAEQILKIPNKTAVVKMNKEDAQRSLESFNAAVRKSPGSKSVTIKTLSKGAESILEAVGYKVKHLPNGQVKVTARDGALGIIRDIRAALNALNGKTATTYVKTVRVGGTYGNKQIPASARGGLLRRAGGGTVGGVQHFDEGGYIDGPGTGTSDSILATFGSGAAARVSNSEYVVQSSAVRKYGVGLLDALNAGRLKLAGFAKGGLTQAQKDARNQLSGSFGISSFGRIAGYQHTSFEKALGAPADVSSLVSALNDAASKIRAAFSGKTESNLLKQLNSVGRSLIGYEKKLTSVNKALDSARDKLSSLRDSAAQLASSVKGNILSAANITQNTGEGPVTVSSIMGGLTQSRDKATAFADALKELQKKGVRGDLIQQIAEAGIQGGGLETAGALLGASSSEISTINSLQHQIAAAGNTAGKATADAVYAAQIKAQADLVHKLDAQQNKLIKSMNNLAKQMEKLINKALKGKAAGGIVGAAASGGLRSDLTWVGEQGPELLDLPAGSRVWSNADSRRKAAAAPWASMLNTPRRAPSYSGTPAAARGDGQPIVIQLKLGEKEFGELWVNTGRRAVQTRGSIEAVLKPPRGR